MRTRLLALVAATTLLVLVAFLVPLAVLLRTVAVERAVQGASVEAQALSALVATADRDALALAVQQVDATSIAEISVFLPDGTVLGSPAPRTPLVELATRGRSASTDDGGGREIVFAVRTDDGPGAVIRTVVPADALAPGVGRAWLLLAVLGFGLLVISLLVADRLGRTLVRSAEELAAVSRRVAAGELDARVGRGGPGELAVVGGALNGLAARIADLLRDERETVADLAHRVRTPLTSLRLDAEALPDPEDAARIGARVDAVQRAVTQAIDQARRRGTAGPAVCDAADTVRGRVAFWSVLAEDTDRGVTVDIAPGPLPVALPRSDLEAAVDALLGNVFAHTPDGTAFAVRLHPRSGGVLLSVSDSGPGPPPGAHVPQRGASGSGSTGLGLDIARRAAEQTGGQLAMGVSAAGGLEVVMRLRSPAGIGRP